MTKTISFNELRKIKDCLPDGSMHKIADRLNINVQTVRNYFGGTNYSFGKRIRHPDPSLSSSVISDYDITISPPDTFVKREK